MKIESIKYAYSKVPMETGFKTATADVASASCLFVKINTDEGIVGHGCGYPTSLTRESKNTAIVALDESIPKFIGLDPLRINNISTLLLPLATSNPSVASAISMACYDIFGKYYDAPLYRLMGNEKDSICTSITLGINSIDEMERYSSYWLKMGATCFKLKLGSDPIDNAEKVRALREHVGSDVAIRCDANGAMNCNDAIKCVSLLDPYSVEFIEQPVVGESCLKELALCSPLRISADESIGSYRSFPALLEKNLFHIATLKINKVGGIGTLSSMINIAEAYDVSCMLGCMSETSISIAASLHVALSYTNVKYADLDTFLFLKYQPASGPIFQEGKLYPSELPGLGVKVDKRVFKKRKEKRRF